MRHYVPEQWTTEEADVLRRYFTNLDGPVFALVNLPEVVRGALFARYSRSDKSLRRLFLDEFVEDLDISGDHTVDARVGMGRAQQLYERVFGDYGDDSIAQLGGVHLACEQVSNLVTKVLERGRLMAYLEQSTRYVPYDTRLGDGRYRYHRDPEVLRSSLGARYVGEMDRMFETYARLLARVQAWLTDNHPPDPEASELAYRRAVRARSLDAVRGVLPAGSLSNLGLFGSGQSYEALLLRLRAHPLPEARAYAEAILAELTKVVPSFVARVDRPDRGGAWTTYLATTREATAQVARDLVAVEEPVGEEPGEGPTVSLLDHDPAGEDKVLAAILHPHTDLPAKQVTRVVDRLSGEERRALLNAYVGERQNRRHRPGRAFEATSYRFEVVSDYGAFRDLQRHRMLTIDWQALSTGLGWELPELVAAAGGAAEFEESMERSRDLHDALAEAFPAQAGYAVALAYRIRYQMELNAREAMHVVELRSSPQGHPAYRRVAQEMHRLIATEAGHPGLAGAMHFADHGEATLGRLGAEQRVLGRRATRS